MKTTKLELNPQQKANLIVLIARTGHLRPEEIEMTRESREKMMIYLISNKKILLTDTDRQILANLMNGSQLLGSEVSAYAEIVGELNKPFVELMKKVANKPVSNKDVKENKR